MTRRTALVFAACFCFAFSMGRSAFAADASFGCKVLLCAAASNPGWSGIPYCVPVMHELFHRLEHGGGWPTCPEGHASGLGYEPYAPCPAGMTAVGNGLTPSPDGNLCVDFSKPQRKCMGGDAGCAMAYPTTPRPRRSDPYYVDIRTGNGMERFYFSLEGVQK